MDDSRKFDAAQPSHIFEDNFPSWYRGRRGDVPTAIPQQTVVLRNNYDRASREDRAFVDGMVLPKDPSARKNIPITSGVLDYFPLALAYVAKISKTGNDQHNPGQPLHWARGKSADHADCIPRHLIDRGTNDTDGLSHTGKLAWRSLALLQEELERELSAGNDPFKTAEK